MAPPDSPGGDAPVLNQIPLLSETKKCNIKMSTLMSLGSIHGPAMKHSVFCATYISLISMSFLGYSLVLLWLVIWIKEVPGQNNLVFKDVRRPIRTVMHTISSP